MSVDRRWEPGAGNLHAGLCPGGGPKGPSLPGLVVVDSGATRSQSMAVDHDHDHDYDYDYVRASPFSLPRSPVDPSRRVLESRAVI